MSDLLLIVIGSVGYGVLSALVPVVNAEAYALAVGATASPVSAVGATLALAVGQTAGKVVIFVAARRGRSYALRRAQSPEQRERARPRRTPGPWRRRLTQWGEQALLLMDRPLPASGVLLVSASTGIPPLAATTVAAGVRSTPLPLFVVCALAGRLLRFAALVAPVVLARN